MKLNFDTEDLVVVSIPHREGTTEKEETSCYYTTSIGITVSIPHREGTTLMTQINRIRTWWNTKCQSLIGKVQPVLLDCGHIDYSVSIPHREGTTIKAKEIADSRERVNPS